MMYIYTIQMLVDNIDNGRIVGCERCGAVFSDEDKKEVKKTCKCNHCNELLDRAKTI